MSNIARQSIIESSIVKIGSIIESDDKFICKVEQEKVRWIPRILTGWHKNISDEVLEINGLNKPIYYVFDGIEFEKALRISLKDNRANLIFRNCTFKDGIYLEDCGDVEFENNTYDYNNDLPIHYFIENCFLCIKRIGKLTFKNDNYTTCPDTDRIKYLRTANASHSFGINITAAKEVEFINTRVETYFPVAINADTIRLKNSILDGTEFGLSAKTIENKDSTIKATEGVIIDNQECDFVGTIDSPLVFYNGEDVTNYSSQTILISKDQVARSQMGVSLIDTLKQIKEEALRQDTRGISDIMGINYGTRKRVPQI